MNMPDMDPSEIRQKILGQHVWIRAHLEGLAKLLPTGPLGAVRLKTAELLDFLQHHMALEDHLLGPALRDADAFGDVRTAKLQQHHVDQAAMTTDLRAMVEDDDVTLEALAPRVRAFIEHLKTELADEEATLLSEEVLRDDLVSIGHAGG